MLRSGERVFLDDVTIAQVEEALGLRVVVVESSGQDFVDAVLHEDYQMERDNENFVYVKAYEREE
jgi:NifB/MoaA-like Fe-S oxidoreductase